MDLKLVESAQRRWRRLNGYQQIIPFLQGKTFVDGPLQEAA